MFGIGSGEMLVFAVVVLIALGPKRLPDFMRTVGKGLREIRKATTDLRKHSGIDELMRDDPAGLRALSRDISRAPAPRREQKLSAHDLAKESPVEGVDIAHAHYLAKQHAAAAKEAAVARDAATLASAGPTGVGAVSGAVSAAVSSAAVTSAARSAVSVGATVAIESAEPAVASTGFEGDTVPDKTELSPPVRHEPTMMGIPAVDPYALPSAEKAKSVPPAKASAPPPPRPSAPPPRPSARPSAPAPRLSSQPPPRSSPPPRPSAPPPVPAVFRSAPPPPPPIGPSNLSGKRPSLPPTVPPPSPSLSPIAPASPIDKPSARESTMAIEVEDLTLDEA